MQNAKRTSRVSIPRGNSTSEFHEGTHTTEKNAHGYRFFPNESIALIYCINPFLVLWRSSFRRRSVLKRLSPPVDFPHPILASPRAQLNVMYPHEPHSRPCRSFDTRAQTSAPECIFLDQPARRHYRDGLTKPALSGESDVGLLNTYVLATLSQGAGRDDQHHGTARARFVETGHMASFRSLDWLRAGYASKPASAPCP